MKFALPLCRFAALLLLVGCDAVPPLDFADADASDAMAIDASSDVDAASCAVPDGGTCCGPIRCAGPNCATACSDCENKCTLTQICCAKGPGMPMCIKSAMPCP